MQFQTAVPFAPESSPSALWALVRDGRYRWMICGHTHERMVRTIGGITVINAGTLVRDQNPCCVVADLATGIVEHHDLADRPG